MAFREANDTAPQPIAGKTAGVDRSKHEDFALPLTTAPMEARSVSELPRGGMLQYEPKWDGFRCLAFKAGQRVELRAKSGKPLSRYFPEIVEALQKIRQDDFVVDGELVIETDGKLRFDALQMRLHPAASRILKLSTESPARLVLFDMLAADGVPLLNSPLRDRRRQLEAFYAGIGSSTTLIVLSPASDDVAEARRWLAEAGDGRIDGVIAKDLEEIYRPAERAMYKIKPLRTADCVVGGFRYQAKGRLVGSLLLGLYDREGRLDHVGFTSTISNVERAGLTRKLESLRQPPGFTGRAPGGKSRWSTERSSAWEPVKPVLVVEVQFDHVTADRFRHGTKLMRWRPDKRPDQCRLEQID